MKISTFGWFGRWRDRRHRHRIDGIRGQRRRIGSGARLYAHRAHRGSKARLSQYKGQVVMVNFWATWCGPCQQEMPLLDQMYKKYKPAGFTLIGVNVDKEAPAVKELLARKPVSFPVLLDPANQVSKAYHVDEMPSSVIIDRKGEIRYIHRGYRPGDENEYQDRIRQLIRE